LVVNESDPAMYLFQMGDFSGFGGRQILLDDSV
jgi:hypothetical protein